MTKVIGVSLVSIICLHAASIELGTIDVEAKVGTQLVKDVSGEDIKSADLGEALFQTILPLSLSYVGQQWQMIFV